MLPPRSARGSSPMLPSPSCRPMGTPSMKFRRVVLMAGTFSQTLGRPPPPPGTTRANPVPPPPCSSFSFRFSELGAQPLAENFHDSAHRLDVIGHEFIEHVA